MNGLSPEAIGIDVFTFVTDVRSGLLEPGELTPDWSEAHAVWVTNVELVEDRGVDFSIRVSLIDTRTFQPEQVVIEAVRDLADTYSAFEGQEFAEHVLVELDEERFSVPPPDA